MNRDPKIVTRDPKIVNRDPKIVARLLKPSSIVSVVALTAAWCGLWGQASVANVGAGFAIGVVATAAFGSRSPSGLRLVPMLKLGGLVARDLVTSTVGVAFEVLTPTDYTDEVIVEVDVGKSSKPHLLLLTVAITLTPGTAVVDVDAEQGCLTLHLLHRDRTEATIAHVKRMAELASLAFPASDLAADPQQEQSISGEAS